MSVSSATLRKYGAAGSEELALEVWKSLYGLKQAGRLWSQLLHTKRSAAAFRCCESDMCLYGIAPGRISSSSKCASMTSSQPGRVLLRSIASSAASHR
uniref:Reverse transcriptase Ty1/copia-type domain-containing protein n=1 Tax=Peronospora matthiolae TaxID=2874970 RepID=A0AAV1UE51_9STRA